MPYIDENEFMTTVIKAIDDNKPSTLKKDLIKYPNEAGSKQRAQQTHVQVFIDMQDRELVTIGTQEYNLIGEVRLVVYSPQGKPLTNHNSVVLAYRQVFDRANLAFTGGKARFDATVVQTNGVANGFYSSTIVCGFHIPEITANITVSQLAGMDFVEQILYALVLPAPDTVQNYLSFDVVSGGSPWITVEDAANPYLTLTVQGGQPLVNNGIRAEAVVDWPFNDGDIVEYEWKIRIPTGFVNDAANGNRWWIMGQWHDKPIGGGEGTGNSPPLSFALGDVSGVNNLSFEYLGDTPSAGDLIPIPLDTWVTIKTKVWWTESATGQAEVYVNGVLNQTETGANMLNALSHYFKIGQYRHPSITTDNTVHIDDIRVSTVGTFTP